MNSQWCPDKDDKKQLTEESYAQEKLRTKLFTLKLRNQENIQEQMD